jgi:hypothetical protein
MNTATTRRFTHTQLVLVLCAGLVALAGCSDNAANPVISREQIGNASVSIRVGKVAGTGISSVELVVSAADMDEIREELTFVDDEATGVVVVSAGLSRLFTLNGYGEAGTLLYSGSELANVVADSRVRVAIIMSPVSHEGTSVPRLSGTIEGFSYLTISPSIFSTNWDDDLEDDGLEFRLLFTETPGGDNILWGNAIVNAEILIYVSTGRFSYLKKYPYPVFQSDDILTSWSDRIRVAYDDLLPNISRDDLSDTALDMVIEVEISLADGSSFADRSGDSIAIPQDVLSMYHLD